MLFDSRHSLNIMAVTFVKAASILNDMITGFVQNGESAALPGNISAELKI